MRGARLEDISKAGLKNISMAGLENIAMVGLKNIPMAGLENYSEATQTTSHPCCQYSTITVLSSII